MKNTFSFLTSNLLKSILFISSLFWGASVNATVQDAQFYEHVAEQYILAQFVNQKDNVKIQVKAQSVDPNRDFEGKCTGYLTAQLQGNTIKSTSLVKIICQRPQNPFTLAVPVKVTRLVEQIVASRNLTRGQVITKDDLKITYSENNSNVYNAVNDSSILIGSRVKQNIKEGSPIRQANFCVVCKGDKITLEANSKGLSLKTSGTAMEDGFINDTIKVRNNSSKKVVEARVTSPTTASINL